MVAAGKSSMMGWVCRRLLGVGLRGQAKWMAIPLASRQPGTMVVVLV